MNIYRILHAGYIFESGDIRIAMDPIFENPFSGNCFAFPDINFDVSVVSKQKFDAVFISHFHEDHCSLVSLALLDRATPIYTYCLHPELFEWIRELGFTKVYSLAMNVPVAVGNFVVTPRRALDADIDSLLQVQVEGLNVLNVVDSWIDEQTLAQLAEAAPWDLVLWPFQTMREIEVLDPRRSEPATGEVPHEWPAQWRALNPRFLVPSACQFAHEPWSWYGQKFFPISYLGFAKQVQAVIPQTQVVRLNPGCGFSLTTQGLSPLERLAWVQPVGPQEVDYQYDPNAETPSTMQVAQHFPELTLEEWSQVQNYLQNQLPAKLESLPAPEAEYFEKPRTWQLRVYGPNEKSVLQNYRIEGQNVAILAEASSFDWLTEIPAWTLVRILRDGQSLSSSYIRVNDHTFSTAQEKQIAETEVLEDPLVRALFTVPFGAYLKSQLRELRGS